jgi:hypothetical protein
MTVARDFYNKDAYNGGVMFRFYLRFTPAYRQGRFGRGGRIRFQKARHSVEIKRLAFSKNQH